VPCSPVVPSSTFFDDVWSSKDGVTWSAETTDAPRAGLRPSIVTFGGNRERSGRPGEASAFLIENDVWQFSPWCRHTERFDAIEPTGTSPERRRRPAIAHDAMIAMNERPLASARSNGRSGPN